MRTTLKNLAADSEKRIAFPLTRMKYNLLSTLFLGAAVPVATGEAAEFIPLGDLPGGVSFSSAIDLSADGSTVLGESYTDSGVQLFRWTSEEGFSLVPGFEPGVPSAANFNGTSISGDGSIVAGFAFTGTRVEGMKWSASAGFLGIGVMPVQPEQSPFSVAVDISADGSAMTAVGTTLETPYSAALLWTSSTGLFSLGFLPEDQPEGDAVSYSFAHAISGDGSVVVGSSASTKHMDRADQAFRWTQGEGMVPLGFIPGEVQSTATAVSADGSVIVGISGLNAFKWTAETGMEPIGNFVPLGVSQDGSVVVGTTEIDFQPVAMIWTSATAAQPLRTYLETKLNLSLPGWESLTAAVAVSDDGSVVAGNGINADGSTEAFLATLESAVETRGAVSYSGPVSFFVADPTGQRYGLHPETGATLDEIPELSLTAEDGKNSAAWPGILTGEHTVQLTGTAAGTYQLDFSFLHGDAEVSGASFSHRLLKGGVHIYAAEISSESASGSSYRLVFADSDGDGNADSLDAIPFSDMRCTLFVGRINTGFPNKVQANGSTLNDAINCAAAKATGHGEFVSAVSELSKQWAASGLIPADGKSVIQKAAAQYSSTMIYAQKRAMSAAARR